MKKVITFEMGLGAIFLAVVISIVSADPQPWLLKMQTAALCALTGGLGGVTYCLRGIYLNACVHKRWDDNWLPWYYIRPVVSFFCGLASWLFLEAGLLVLESQQEADATNFAYYALAFIAGYNVDKFLSKLEDIGYASWGISKSRTAKSDSPDKAD